MYINIQLIWTRINTEYGILVSNFILLHIYIVSTILFSHFTLWFRQKKMSFFARPSYHFEVNLYYSFMRLYTWLNVSLSSIECACAQTLFYKLLPDKAVYAQFCKFYERFNTIKCSSRKKRQLDAKQINEYQKEA